MSATEYGWAMIVLGLAGAGSWVRMVFEMRTLRRENERLREANRRRAG